jgi:hypothetical protein
MQRDQEGVPKLHAQPSDELRQILANFYSPEVSQSSENRHEPASSSTEDAGSRQNKNECDTAEQIFSFDGSATSSKGPESSRKSSTESSRKSSAESSRKPSLEEHFNSRRLFLEEGQRNKLDDSQEKWCEVHDRVPHCVVFVVEPMVNPNLRNT